MARNQGSGPAPGSPEWQAELNAEVEQHDEQQRESGNENQNFEISQGDMVLTAPVTGAPLRRRTRGAHARVLAMFAAWVADIESEPMPRVDAALALVRIGGAA